MDNDRISIEKLIFGAGLVKIPPISLKRRSIWRGQHLVPTQMAQQSDPCDTHVGYGMLTLED